MEAAVTLIRVKARFVRRNTLLMNALYLMASTFILGASGFLFWIIIAKSYDSASVGLATTLLSVSSLVSLLGLAGFDTTFVRFLPASTRKNDYINTGLMVTLLMTISLAVLLAFVLPLFMPSLSMLTSPWAFLSFLFFTVATSLNTLTNAVFLAFKHAWYILVINGIFSAAKIILPLLVIQGDAMTIFTLAGLAQLLGLALSIYWMQKKFNYVFSPKIHADTLKIVRRFSLSIYISNNLSLLPPTLLPLIVLHLIGAKEAAYYYMAFTIANILYTIVFASMQSVLAEGSHNRPALKTHIVSAAKLITAMLVPAILIVILMGNTMLGLFGQEYAKGAGQLLYLLAMGALPVACYAALTTIFKVIKLPATVIYMNGVSAAIVIALSCLWVPTAGLQAVGWAWLISNTAACFIGVIVLVNKKGGQ